MDVALLRSSFEAVRPVADEAARAFYETLLRTYPQVRPLFAETDFTQQRRKLMTTLAAVVDLADKPGELGPLLDTMGRSHAGYGVTAEMYPYVGASLVHTLAAHLGDAWTPELATTWLAALDVVSAAMIEAQQAHTA